MFVPFDFDLMLGIVPLESCCKESCTCHWKGCGLCHPVLQRFPSMGHGYGPSLARCMKVCYDVVLADIFVSLGKKQLNVMLYIEPSLYQCMFAFSVRTLYCFH